MKNLANLVSEIPWGFKMGLLGLFFLGLIGCSTTKYTPTNTRTTTTQRPQSEVSEAQEAILLGKILQIYGGSKSGEKGSRAAIITGDILEDYGRLEHEKDVAREGRSQITINNNPNNEYSKTEKEDEFYTFSHARQKQELIKDFKNLDRSKLTSEQRERVDRNIRRLRGTPKGLFMYKTWADFNENGLAETDEFIGLDDSPYALDGLSNLVFSFCGRNPVYDGEMNLKIWDLSSGKIVNYFDKEYNSTKVQSFYCETKYLVKGGKYKAVLNTANGETFTLDFETMK